MGPAEPTATSKAGLYRDTIRSMRAGQLAARTRRLLPPRLLAAGCERGRRASWRPLPPGWIADPAPQSGPTPPPDQDRRFRAFGIERRFGEAGFWAERSDGLLFAFHLHGFSDLANYAVGARTAEASAFWGEVADDWLDSNSRPRAPSWHPYPTSERVIAWSVAISAIEEWPAELRDRIAREIWRQAHYLTRTVEHDIGGNHVLRNATAIALAGTLYPDSRLADRGLRLLERELERQILADGGHEERSPSYHRRISGELAGLAAILEAGGGAPPWLSKAASSTEAWMRRIAGPDGSLPLLNDAWSGPPVRIDGERPPVDHLAASGYVVLASGGDRAVLDVGPVCPPHLPAHAHADVLSFVLWADGEQVLVDPGTYLYSGPERGRFRGTAAHSTVEVDGGDQCVYWGDFRAAGRPNVTVGRIESSDGATVVDAAHDGYRRLADPVVHRRAFAWVPGSGIVVVDRLDCGEAHRIRSTLRPVDDAAAEGRSVGPFAIEALGGTPSVGVRADQVSPFLGTMRPTAALQDRRTVGPGDVFGWSLLRDPAGVIELDATRVVLRTVDGTELTLPLRWSAPDPGGV